MSALSKTANARTDARKVREAFQRGVDVAERDSKWQAFRESSFTQKAKGAAKGFGHFIATRTAGIRGDFAAMYYAVHERHAYKREQKKINKMAAWLEERGIKLDESQRYSNRMDMNEYLRTGNKNRFNPYRQIEQQTETYADVEYEEFVSFIESRKAMHDTEIQVLTELGMVRDAATLQQVRSQLMQRDVNRDLELFNDYDDADKAEYIHDMGESLAIHKKFAARLQKERPDLVAEAEFNAETMSKIANTVVGVEATAKSVEPSAKTETPSAATSEPANETAKTYTEALEARAKAFEERSQALDAEMEAEFQKFAAKYQNKYQSLVTEYDDVIKAKSQPAVNTNPEQKSEPDVSVSTNDESKIPIFRYTWDYANEYNKKPEHCEYEYYVNTKTGDLTYDYIDGDKRSEHVSNPKDFERLYKEIKANTKGEYEIDADLTGENKDAYDKYCKSTKTVFAYGYEHNDGDEIWDETWSYKANAKTGSFIKVSTNGRGGTTVTKATVDELNEAAALVDKEVAYYDRLRAQGRRVRGGYYISSKFTDENKALVNEVTSPATKKAKAMDKVAKMDAAKAEAKEEAKAAKKARRTSKKTSQPTVEATQAEQPKAIEAKATTKKAPEAKPVETKPAEAKETFAEAKPVETSAVAVPVQEANGKQSVNFIGMIKSSFGLASEALGAISQFQDKKASMKQSNPQIIDGGSYTEIEDKESKRSDRVAQIGDAIPVENAPSGPTEQALLPAGV